MKKLAGFTLIEVIVFIVLTSLMASSILLAITLATQNTPTVNQQAIATQTAQTCMEWLLGQRHLNGYHTTNCIQFNTPDFCRASAPQGYQVTANNTCMTFNGDADYEILHVTVSGLGNTTLTTLIANY